jgi:hypothetical protein
MFGIPYPATPDYASYLGISSHKTTKVKEFDDELFYRINPSNWYKYFPYKFEIHSIGGTVTTASVFSFNVSTGKSGMETTKEVGDTLQAEFHLPIPPQQISIQHIPATEATPTMGGIVEEVSYPTLFTITISGSTGMSVGSEGFGGSPANKWIGEKPAKSVYQRETYEELTGIANVAGRVANAALNTLDRVASLVTPEVTVPFSRYGSGVYTPDSGMEQEDDTAIDFWNPPTPANSSWGSRLLKSITSGFMEEGKKPSLYCNGFAIDHAMRQFFLMYQKNRAQDTWKAETALFFVDTKSNTRYRITPRSLNFSRTSDSPFTTTYSMVFRAWDLQDASMSSSTTTSAVDRLAPGGDLAEAYTVNAVSLYRQMRRVEMLASNPGRAAGQLAGSAINDAKGSYFG